MPINANDREKIAHLNAERLLGLGQNVDMRGDAPASNAAALRRQGWIPRDLYAGTPPQTLVNGRPVDEIFLVPGPSERLLPSYQVAGVLGVAAIFASAKRTTFSMPEASRPYWKFRWASVLASEIRTSSSSTRPFPRNLNNLRLMIEPFAFYPGLYRLQNFRIDRRVVGGTAGCRA
jgi:hypothetical protein